MKHRGLVKLLEYTKYNFSPSKRKFKSTLVTFVDEIKAFVKSKTGKLNVLHVFAKRSSLKSCCNPLYNLVFHFLEELFLFEQNVGYPR